MSDYRQRFKDIVVQRGFLSEDQASLVLDFYQFEGRRRHPAEVAVSLSVMTDAQAQDVMRALASSPDASAASLSSEAVQGGVAGLPGVEAPRGATTSSEPASRPSRRQSARGMQPFTSAQRAPSEMRPGERARAGDGGGGAAERVSFKGADVALSERPAQSSQGMTEAPALAQFRTSSFGDSQHSVVQMLAVAEQEVDSQGAVGKLIQHAITAGASDLHLHSGQPPFMRVAGQIVDGFAGGIQSDVIEAGFRRQFNNVHREVFKRDGAVDLCVGFAGGYRLRINLFRSLHGLSAAIRLIPAEVPTLQRLNLPPSLKQLVGFHQGLVLVTGPANSGKTSTLAALINQLNLTRQLHIVTIEDPIEYIHQPRQCTITQRQVGFHTVSYASALHGALREDPDVIVIGELRDMETIRIALNASETGHLVLGTLHTRNVESTISRVLDAFGEEEAQIRGTLADALKGVFVQQLVRSTRGGLVPVIEMMFNNNAIAHCIRKRKLHQLQSLMQAGRGQNMLLWEDSVRDHQQRRAISPQLAKRLLGEDGRTA